MVAGFIFFVRKVKNQRPRLLGTVGGGFMGKIELIDTDRLTEKQARLNMETEYSCAMKSHFRKFGNQMSGSGNHLCNHACLLA